MKISYYIFLTFSFILLLFSITTYINFRLSKVVNENEAYFSRSTEIIRKSGRFQRNMLIMLNGLRGYLLTGENSFVESYGLSNNENDSILNELTSLITDKSQSRLLKDIKKLNDRWTEEYTEPLRQARMISDAGPADLKKYNKIYKERFASGDEKKIQAELLIKFKEFTADEYKVRDERKLKLSGSISSTRVLSLALTIVSILAGLIVIIFLVRKISRRIKEMTSMANTIAAGNYNIKLREAERDELSSLGRSLNHMANELSKNISQLIRTNEELDQFAHIVSHDLKRPLRGIGNVITWIEEDHIRELTPQVIEYLELIKGRIFRAENLIAGLLSYASVDKGDFKKGNINLNLLVDEILENFIGIHNIIIDTQPLPSLHSEKVLLFQIFSNLIDNAIKYNDKETVKIQIYYKEYEQQYEFFVKDNGIGIPEAYHARIFLIFQTLQDTGSYESTGIGLAIVKKILDGKRQEIRVDSEPGKGSTFSFTWEKA